MVDRDTFLTTLYVMIDDFCKSELPAEAKQVGPQASLSRREVMTLALFGQWTPFPSERALYRSVTHHWRGAFPRVPDRSQLNRLQRQHRDALTAFALHVVTQMHAQDGPYEALDSTAAPTRDAKRRALGWVPGQAAIGWRNRIGWYEGFHLLLSVTPHGVITGSGSASTHDQQLAATFFALRQEPSPRLLRPGLPAQGSYVAEKGFAGERPQHLWAQQYHADVVTAPHQPSKRRRWPKALRRWLAGLRPSIQTVNDKLLNTFRLVRERPHDLTGCASSSGGQSRRPYLLYLVQSTLGEAAFGFR